LKRNVLIFHAGALGDFILTWPLAVALGRIFAQSRIIYVTAAQKGELARRVLGIESIDIECGWHALFAEDARASAATEAVLDGAHLIVSFLAQPGDLWSRNVQRLSPEAKHAVVQPRPQGEYAGHITEFLADQLADLPLVRKGMQQIVASLSQRPIVTISRQAERIVIHPGAGAPEKCWPAERYLELIRQMRAPVRVLLGEAERERWPAKLVRQFESVSQVVFPATYVELLDHLRQANVFIGHDSGPTHLAAIIGVPTIALYGKPNRNWQPLGPNVKLVCRQLTNLSVDDVLQNISQ
jgi:ADP-heptose:LPS heptosyltransferase